MVRRKRPWRVAVSPGPQVGHDVKLMKFDQDPTSRLWMSFQNFARNDAGCAIKL